MFSIIKVRLVIISCLLLLPQLLRAQSFFEPFRPGTYTLAGNPAQRIQGKLKVHGNTLEVLLDPGNTKYYKAAEVMSVRLTDRTKYRTISGLLVEGQTRALKPVLAQVVDSGQVTLLYLRSTSSPGGGLVGGTVSYSRPLFMLQRASEELPVVLPDAGASRGGKNFREALATYVAQRPDLLKLLTDEEIVTDNLPYFIHALNTGQPFTTED